VEKELLQAEDKTSRGVMSKAIPFLNKNYENLVWGAYTLSYTEGL
jgi:hypothetical protein